MKSTNTATDQSTFLLLKVICVLLVLAGLFLSVFNTNPPVGEPPRVIGLNASAMGSLNITKSEIDAVFEEAEASIGQYYSSAKTYSFIVATLKWIGIIASAIITIIAAFGGQVLDPNAALGEVDQSKINAKYLRVVALLAAFNTLSIGLLAPMQESKESSIEAGDKIHKEVMSVRSKLLSQVSTSEQLLLLEELKNLIRRSH